nr:SUMF1/EgtB/PvdO family nonheme iron enzyme [Pseudohalocynthiibacter aestuariivivens]
MTKRSISPRYILMAVAASAAICAAGYSTFRDARPAMVGPDTVMIPAGEVSFRPLGTFAQDGKVRTPTAVPIAVDAFEIMKYQVSRDQYAACVADQACAPVPAVGGQFPQTQVNWIDATAYAQWLSKQTRQTWRLPTEAEWQHAAAERYGDATAGPEALDPGERMLAQYAQGLLLRGTSSPTLRPPGGFGENSYGVADISGNVWEWTDGCVENGTISADGSAAERESYCGVRVAGGVHRAAVIDFIRDASVGGCAVGLPPDHLGFRLVRGG